MAKLTREDVLRLAKLARLELDKDELEEFTAELSEILQYVDLLQSVDVSGLEPTSQVTGLVNVTRKDVTEGYGYEPSELLKNVPAVEDNQIKVRRVL
jgi:aspartyl-tRNA(Asn)/glutamyl-tRNA(Gln) amidotransferase subunit C